MPLSAAEIAHWNACAERLSREEMLAPGAAAALVPPVRAGRVSVDTLVRWITRGKPGRAGGEKVRLDGIRIGGTGWRTSREALTRFFGALSAAAAGAEIQVPVYSSAAAAADQRRVEELLRMPLPKG